MLGIALRCGRFQHYCVWHRSQRHLMLLRAARSNVCRLLLGACCCACEGSNLHGGNSCYVLYCNNNLMSVSAAIATPSLEYLKYTDAVTSRQHTSGSSSGWQQLQYLIKVVVTY
jgi:hypothetical protein